MPLCGPEYGAAYGFDFRRPPRRGVLLHRGLHALRHAVEELERGLLIDRSARSAGDLSHLVDHAQEARPMLGANFAGAGFLMRGQKREGRQESELAPQHQGLVRADLDIQPRRHEVMRKGAYILSARRIGPAGKRQLDEGEGARLLDQPGRNAGGFDPNCRRNDRFALFFAQGCDMFDAVEKWNDQGAPQGVAGNAIERRSQFGRLHRDEAHIDRRAQFRGGLDARLEIAEAFASHRDPIGVKTLAGRGTGDAHHPVPLPGQQSADPARPSTATFIGLSFSVVWSG